MSLVPHDYQEEAIDFIDEKPHCAIFGDCGVGKTIICLSAVSRLLRDFDIKAVLIVAPLRVARMTWPLEIEEWDEFSWMDYTLLHGDKKNDLIKPGSQIYLVNYEGLLWLEQQLIGVNHKDWPFDMIIWDELTRMKNSESQRFRKWKKFLKYFKRRVGLTGTPMANGYTDLWAQFFVIDRGEALGETNTSFLSRFFRRCGYEGYDQKPRAGAVDIMQDLIAPKTLRISADDHLDVPPLTFEDIELKLPAKHKKDYETLEKELFVELDKGVEVEAVTAAVLSNKCLQFAGGSVYIQDEDIGMTYTRHIHDVKMNALKKLMKKIKTPVLVAYSFQHERDNILKEFPDAVMFKSGYTQKKELQIQKDWNAGKIKMLVCHPASAGHGLNLQKGSHIGIWYSLNWSLEYYMQLNARIHRQGQKSPVTFYRLIMMDTIDEAVATTLERKEGSQMSLLKAINMYRRTK